MKALALTLALAVAAAGTHADSHAQDGKSPSDLTVLIPSKTWSAAAVPRSPSEVADAWSGAIDGIAWWVNLYGEQAVRKQIDVLLRESVADARKLIEWTGDGALVEVRLIERSHPDSPFKAVGILGDRLWLAGTGARPEDALYDYWSRPSLRPGVPDSWSVHPLGETYFWIKLEGDKPVIAAVERGLARDLDARLRDDFGRYAADHARRSWNARTRWENVAVATKKRLADTAARKAVDSAMLEIRASQERVAKADAELQRALQRERRAASALQTVRLLQGVLTVVQLAQEVRTIIDEPLPQLSNASTAAAVINVTETVYKDSTVQKATMMATFSGSLADLQKYLNLLGAQAAKAGAPASVNQSLQIPKPQ
jgi:hypothetical protein